MSMIGGILQIFTRSGNNHRGNCTRQESEAGSEVFIAAVEQNVPGLTFQSWCPQPEQLHWDGNLQTFLDPGKDN